MVTATRRTVARPTTVATPAQLLGQLIPALITVELVLTLIGVYRLGAGGRPVTLMGAGSALALTRPADAVAAGQLLGDAFAAVLEPEPSGDDERVRTIGVY